MNLQEIIPKPKTNVEVAKSERDWLGLLATNASKEFLQRFEKIKQEYDELLNEISFNDIIYKSEIKFEPVINQVYYLYNNMDTKTSLLSMLSPTDWRRLDIIRYEFLGEFKLMYNGKWIKI
jgi:hypothetical protein